MSAPVPPLLVAQLFEHHVQFASFRGGILESYKESPLEPPALLDKVVATVTANSPPKLQLIAAAAVSDREFHLSPGPGESASPVFTSCHAGTGVPSSRVAERPFLRIGAGAETRATERERLAGWTLSSDTLADATLAQLGAIAFDPALAAAPVLIWDLAPARSFLLLVDTRGVAAVVPCSVGLNDVFAAIQEELKLRFRSAAARLFLSGTYDFADVATPVTARVLGALHVALDRLPAHPSRLHIAGLNRHQAWFNLTVAKALHFTPWQPDWGTLAYHCGLDFASASLRESLPPSAAGALVLASGAARADGVWSARWSDEPGGLAPGTAAPFPLSTSEQAAGIPSESGPRPLSTGPAPRPTVVARNALSARRAARVSAAPVALFSASSEPPSAAVDVLSPEPSRRGPLSIAVGMILLLTVGGSYLAKVQTEANGSAQQKALAAAETLAHQQAEAEEARVRAEAAAHEAEGELARARARGRLVLRGLPPEAVVTIDDRLPATGIADHEELAPGEHRLTITLPGHHVLERTFMIVGGESTEFTDLHFAPFPEVVAAPELASGSEVSAAPDVPTVSSAAEAPVVSELPPPGQ